MNVVIIFVRGGSKCIFKKNIKLFCGKLMVVYVIENVLVSFYVDKVVVLIDDEFIVNVVRDYGVEVLFMRFVELVDDYIGISFVVCYVLSILLEKGWDINYCVCVYVILFFLIIFLINFCYEMLMNVDNIDYVFIVVRFLFLI